MALEITHARSEIDETAGTHEQETETRGEKCAFSFQNFTCHVPIHREKIDVWFIVTEAAQKVEF